MYMYIGEKKHQGLLTYLLLFIFAETMDKKWKIWRGTQFN